MADSSVPITAGTGTNIDTRTNTTGEHRQVMVMGNDGDFIAGVEPFGALQVAMAPTTTFYDSFNAGVADTVDRWTVTGGSPTFANGEMSMPTTVSTYNRLGSKDVMRAEINGYVYVAHGFQLEAAAATGAGRFWGLGTQASVPSATSLIQDGIGFEIDQGTGALAAVTYAGGVKTQVAALTRPSDGLMHRYAIYVRVTQAFWFIDGLNVAVASQAWPDVRIPELPVTIVRNNAASYTGTPVMDCIAVGAGDTGRNATKISDSVVPNRQARVTDVSQITNALNTGSQGNALNVNPNAVQKATYIANTFGISTGALTVNTPKPILSLEHAASATKTVRIRRITVSAIQTTSLAGQDHVTVTRGTAASTAGTVTTANPPLPNTPASETVVKTIPTITAATTIMGYTGSVTAATANTGFTAAVIYDWQESGETIPLTLRAGFLDTIVINAQSTAAKAYVMTITVIFTEE